MAFIYNSPNFGTMTSSSMALDSWASKSTLLSAPTAAPPAAATTGFDPSSMATMGLVGGVFGAVQSAYGAFSTARATKQNLEFQSQMSEINARMAENQAQSIMLQGERAIGQVGLKAGKVKSSQKASQAARGIVIGEGSAAEEVATTELMAKIDSLTINANTVQAANAARTQSVNYANQSLLQGTSASSISPMSSAATSLVGSATTVANAWYTNTQQAKLAALLSG